MNNVYKTKDLLLASYLYYCNIKLAEDYDEESKSWIFVNKDGECEKLSLDLKNGEVLVNPLNFESGRRNLLSMVRKSR